jgi:hypothetical protein
MRRPVPRPPDALPARGPRDRASREPAPDCLRRGPGLPNSQIDCLLRFPEITIPSEVRSYQIRACAQRGHALGRAGRPRPGPVDPTYDLISDHSTGPWPGPTPSLRCVAASSAVVSRTSGSAVLRPMEADWVRRSAQGPGTPPARPGPLSQSCRAPISSIGSASRQVARLERRSRAASSSGLRRRCGSGLGPAYREVRKWSQVVLTARAEDRIARVLSGRVEPQLQAVEGAPPRGGRGTGSPGSLVRSNALRMLLKLYGVQPR